VAERLIVALLVPQLCTRFLGEHPAIDTHGMFALFRSSAFWLSLFAGAWLALDPIVKCSFVVVHQHLQSRHEGDDLRGLLASLPREQQKKAQMIASTAAGGRVAIGALVLLAAILQALPRCKRARSAGVANPKQHGDTRRYRARGTDSKIAPRAGRESRRAIYRWHDAEHPSRLPGLTSYWIRSAPYRARLGCGSEIFFRKHATRG